jgi:putative SOS response-associated peptidase YedK
VDALAWVRGLKSAPIEGEHELFGFQTTEANSVVARIHPKAMPVILTKPEEVDLWLAADAPKALELQRPLPDDRLRIVASGEREDRGALGRSVVAPRVAIEARQPVFRAEGHRW